MSGSSLLPSPPIEVIDLSDDSGDADSCFSEGTAPCLSSSCGSGGSSGASDSSSVEIISSSKKTPALPFSFRFTDRQVGRVTRSHCKACRKLKFLDENFQVQPYLEAFLLNRWWDVDTIRKDSADNYIVCCVGFDRKDVRTNINSIRLRSRRASDKDCSLLREGVDVCVFARHPETREKAWHDAQIDSIHNRPHATKCECIIFAKLYSIGDTGSCKKILHQLEAVGIARIKILQAPDHIDFQLVIEAAIQPGLTKRHWSRDVGDIDSVKHKSKHGLETPHNCGGAVSDDEDEDGEEVANDNSSSDDFETLLNARVDNEPVIIPDSEDDEPDAPRETEMPDASREAPARKPRVSRQRPAQAPGTSWHRSVRTAEKKTKKPVAGHSSSMPRERRGSAESQKPRKRTHHRNKSVKDTLHHRNKEQPKDKSFQDKSTRRKKNKRHREEDGKRCGDNAATARRKKNRRTAETKALEHVEEDDLEREQGYVVSLDNYWNNRHVTLEQKSKTDEHMWMDKIFGEMEMAFQKQTHETQYTTSNKFEGECEEHDYVMDDREGLICIFCGHVGIPINRMAADPELQMRLSRPENDMPDIINNANLLRDDQGDEDDVHVVPSGTHRELHPHQKRAVAFLKRNIVDEKEGCILAHSPGTGKTFATISFYVKYREIKSGCRLLVLCPKGVQKVWRDEFQRSLAETPFCINSTVDAKRREIFVKWHRQRSVLVMSFCLFMTLSSHEQFRGYVLNSPELVILDEGHIFRSERTRMRQAVMVMRTKLRILLSGTLFQNRFEELFNIIYLARPSFIEQLGIRISDGCSGQELEDRARKRFIEEIGRKFDEGHWHREMKAAKNRLIAMTRNFTDHYSGDILKELLPGLHDYEIRIPLTELQLETLKKSSCPKDFDIALTKVCVHPWLDKGEFFNEMAEVDVRGSMKTAFVMKLIELCQFTGEKVLIFGELLPPLRLIIRMLELRHKWSLDKQVFFLHGELPLAERHERMTLFNLEGSEAKVCIASIRASAEGISLTGASRVVLLHPVWNSSVTNQAINRAFRLGQTRKVFVYRLVAAVEKRKNSRTIWKDWCSKTIFSTGSDPATLLQDKERERAALDAQQIFSEDRLLAEINAAGIIEQVQHRAHSEQVRVISKDVALENDRRLPNQQQRHLRKVLEGEGEGEDPPSHRPDHERDEDDVETMNVEKTIVDNQRGEDGVEIINEKTVVHVKEKTIVEKETIG